MINRPARFGTLVAGLFVAGLIIGSGTPSLAKTHHTAPTAGTLQAQPGVPTPLPMYGPAYHGDPGNRAPETLDAFATVTYALSHAPSLFAQRATVANLDATFQKARATEYPTNAAQLQSQLSKQANESGQFAQYGLTPQSNYSQNTAQLTGSYNLYNGTAQLNAQQARKQLLNASYELSRQQEQLVATVSAAFFTLAEDHGVVDVDRADLAYQQALLDSAQAEYHVGRVAGVDVLRAQVA